MTGMGQMILLLEHVAYASIMKDHLIAVRPVQVPVPLQILPNFLSVLWIFPLLADLFPLAPTTLQSLPPYCSAGSLARPQCALLVPTLETPAM